MIHAFLLNLVLAVVYVALVAEMSYFNFIAGFVVGYIVIWVYGLSKPDGPRYNQRVFQFIRFVGYFLWILTKANLQIAWEIITPKLNQTPRIIRYPVEGFTDVEITTLANLITLTPGTLVVDVSDDNNWLYIHCMYAREPEVAVAGLDELATRMRQEVFGK